MCRLRKRRLSVECTVVQYTVGKPSPLIKIKYGWSHGTAWPRKSCNGSNPRRPTYSESSLAVGTKYRPWIVQRDGHHGRPNPSSEMVCG